MNFKDWAKGRPVGKPGTHGYMMAEAAWNAGRHAAIAGIEANPLSLLAKAQAEHEKNGGCPGCGSTVYAVHNIPCSETKDELY